MYRNFDHRSTFACNSYNLIYVFAQRFAVFISNIYHYLFQLKYQEMGENQGSFIIVDFNCREREYRARTGGTERWEHTISKYKNSQKQYKRKIIIYNRLWSEQCKFNMAGGRSLKSQLYSISENCKERIFSKQLLLRLQFLEADRYLKGCHF